MPTAARYTVQADTEQACREQLAELCHQLGAQVTLTPRLLPGSRSWMARAERQARPAGAPRA